MQITTSLRAVMRQQWLSLRRDRRLRLLGGALLLMVLTSIVAGVTRSERLVVERNAAAQADKLAWQRQGVTNPHGAAHFGHYAFKPVSTLSAFDPGLSDHLGTMLRLEAHRQSAAGNRPSDDGAALTRFGSFSAAAALQMLAPLLVILIAFTSFSGEHARRLLHQEIGAGANPRVLLLGRWCVLSLAIVALLAVVGAAGMVGLYFAGAGSAEFGRLALMLSGYALYLGTFLAIALGVSAVCRSARTTLTFLLAFWVTAVLLLPRLAPAVASLVHPAPSLPQFQEEVTDAIELQMDGDQPRETRAERLNAMVLKKYGVARLEDVPVHPAGVTLQYSEQLSTEVFKQHFARVFDIYRLQASVRRAFSAASPLIALQPWSAALAGSDFASHQRFLREAEDYRYGFVQRLNNDIMLNRPRTDDVYKADVARITAGLDHFAPSVESLSTVIARQWPDLLILSTWAFASIAAAMLAADRLRRTS